MFHFAYTLQVPVSRRGKSIFIIVLRERNMCYLAETWHIPCSHWGSRTVESRCAVGMLAGYEARGCLFSNTNGCVRVNWSCSACMFRVRRSSIQDGGEPDFTKLVKGKGIPGMTLHWVLEGEKDWLLRRLGLREHEGGMVASTLPSPKELVWHLEVA
jgi:hypothetical protein